VPATSTTSTTLPACLGTIELDPADTVTTLRRGVAEEIPFTLGGSGVFDVVLSDGGAGGQAMCSGVCFGRGPGSGSYAYTAAPAAPASIALVLEARPHSPGFVCGPGSGTAMDAETFPVTDP
jgi:hypothetical protein